MESLGGHLIKWDWISFIDVEQVKAGWCWGDSIHIIRSFIEQSFNIINHSEFDLTWVRKVNGHAKVIMDLPTSNGERGFLTKLALQVCNDVGHHIGIHMGYFKIIDMPEDCALFSINLFVCNTPVIRVDFKAPVVQLFVELLPEQESCS